jgi:hypothetical protein
MKPGLTFRIMYMVSIASLIVDVVTNNGWMTFFTYMSLMHPSFTLMRAPTFPSVCAFLRTVTILMGFNLNVPCGTELLQQEGIGVGDGGAPEHTTHEFGVGSLQGSAR